MKIAIIEDEEPSAKRLSKLINEIDPSVEILTQLESVSSAIDWFNEHENPDLIFSDIQLSDGLSFDIFRNVKIDCPIIFTTAFDQYAIDAFKVNSIDYLLKPLKKEELKTAIEKFHKLGGQAGKSSVDISKLLEAIHLPKSEFKKRFVIRYGEHIKTIMIEDVAYFNTEDKINFLTTKEGRRYTIDYNLDALEAILDPKIFFRINRQFIIGIHAISDMFSYSKSRVLIKLNPPSKHETIVSTERSGDFKLWLDDDSR